MTSIHCPACETVAAPKCICANCGAPFASENPAPSDRLRGLKWSRAGWVEAFAKPEGLGLWYSIQPDKPVHGPGDPPFTCTVIWGEPGQNMRECLGSDFENLEAAKAVAQADFSKRIQSILAASEGSTDV